MDAISRRLCCTSVCTGSGVPFSGQKCSTSTHEDTTGIDAMLLKSTFRDWSTSSAYSSSNPFK